MTSPMLLIASSLAFLATLVVGLLLVWFAVKLTTHVIIACRVLSFQVRK